MNENVFNILAHFEDLKEKRTEKDFCFQPFINYGSNTKSKRCIPQLSSFSEKVHVICKITDDFAAIQQYSFDDETLPPKVLCWNDLSALDLNMATKTVKAALEHEYKCFIDDLSMEFFSVSVSNDVPLPIPELRKDCRIIYHILDPSLAQKSKISDSLVKNSRISSSRSTIQLQDSKDPSINQSSLSININIPIQNDAVALKNLSSSAPDGSVFILDCSYASKALRIIEENNSSHYIFAASHDSLMYIPYLPCDLFTSCMLTPAHVALLFQSKGYNNINGGMLSSIDIQSMIDMLNRSPQAKNMISLLENALEAYVDEMLCDSMNNDSSLFYKVFRSDPLISKLFSNYIFATYVLKYISLFPLSSPQIPDLSSHPLWDSFLLQVDRALFTLKESIKPSFANVFSYKQLLDEQLSRLQNWLCFPKHDRSTPNELSFLPLLLKSESHFISSIDFISHYLSISSEMAFSFLKSKSFPIIASFIENNRDFSILDDVILISITKIIMFCIDYSHSLKDSIKIPNNLLEHALNSKNQQLKISSLSCVLLLYDLPTLHDYLHSDKTIELFKLFCSDKSFEIRVLTNLILGKLGVPFCFPYPKIGHEPNPLCRGSMIHRLYLTISNRELSDNDSLELFFELILCLNDPFFVVREESLVALSLALEMKDNTFFEAFSDYLINWSDDRSRDPIINLLSNEIQILLYDPSPRLNKCLFNFLEYLSCKINMKTSVSLLSHIVDDTLALNFNNPLPFFDNFVPPNNNLQVREAPLIGKPAVSLSGLLACADNKGKIHSQVFSSDKISKHSFDFFRPGLFSSSIPNEFRTLYENRLSSTQTSKYISFVNDYSILSISDRSQVVISDVYDKLETKCAFWMSPPDSCSSVLVDYHLKSHQLLFSTGSSIAHIFDLETQTNTNTIKIARAKCTSINWLQPYSSLFCTANECVSLYDSRSKNTVSSISLDGDPVLGCNSSSSMPLYLVIGQHSGEVSMIDMRMMTVVVKQNINTKVSLFEVHPQLPFCLALSNDLISFSFENGLLSPKNIGVSTVPSAFSLHPTESQCVIRYQYKVQTINVDY